MRNKLGVVLGSSLILTALLIACGGHESSDVLGSPGPLENASSSSGATSSSTSTSSGQTSSSTSSTSSSASSTGGTEDACPICAAPPPGCVFVGGCSCQYRCPDAGGPSSCEWGKADACPTGYFCDASDCLKGVCVPKGTTVNGVRNPQCGCDGVTYWNSSVAAGAGMSIRAAGACAGDVATKCGGVVARACPTGASCNLQVKNKSDCGGVVAAQGVCWQLPPSCGAVVIGGRSRPCGGGTPACTDTCTAIQKQATWYEDGSCPQ